MIMVVGEDLIDKDENIIVVKFKYDRIVECSSMIVNLILYMY